MEPFAVSDEGPQDGEIENSHANSRKLVPWLSWEEWVSVMEALFSDSPNRVSFGLRRVSAWRGRGCLPVAVEVTASIIEVRQKDPYFNKVQRNDSAMSDEMLAMLYCMAIVRLVNGVVEKSRKRSALSISEAAEAIGLPRTLIDIRHEGSHQDLPSVQIVRAASEKALSWLHSSYWEAQRNAIPSQDIRKIRYELFQLISNLGVQRKANYGSSPSSRSAGPKKHATKGFKKIIKFYSSFPSEVVSVLLDFLLLDLASVNSPHPLKDSRDGAKIQSLLELWNPLITRCSSKEPDLLFNLLEAVLNMIETLEVQKRGKIRVKRPLGRMEYHTEHLSSVFAWLIGILTELRRERQLNCAGGDKAPSSETFAPKIVLKELIRKCFVLSAYGNKQLIASAINLAKLAKDSRSLEKLGKFSALISSDFSASEERSPSTAPSENAISEQADSISQARETVIEMIRGRLKRGKVTELTNVEVSDSKPRWVLVKSWIPCPIGMLPHDFSSSGRLPVLGGPEVVRKAQTQNGNVSLLSAEKGKQNRKRHKGEAACDNQQLDESSTKKIRETVEGPCPGDGELLPCGGVEGCLMIDGVLKKVTKEELSAIKTSVTTLVNEF